MILFCAAGSIWQLWNFVISIFGAALLWSVCYGASLTAGVSALLLGGLLSYLLTGQYEPALVSVFTIAATAFVLYFGAKRKVPIKALMVIGAAASAFVSFGVMAYASYLSYGAVSMDLIVTPYMDVLEQYYDYFEKQAVSLSREEFMIRARESMKYLLIGITISTGIIKSYVSFIMGRFLVKRAYLDPMSSYTHFAGFKLSREGGFLYFIAYAVMFLINGAQYQLVASNFIIIMSPAFLLAGISAFNFMLDKLKWSRKRKIIIYVVIFATLLYPSFNLVLGLTAFGAADAIVNYRKIPNG
ncbi:hypothetical protein SDC9_159003 [bioreactor metagenome]|uniref:DUF2232 domain-containing protein n=1 Tax=bioreactor metagenome TaxID=1076179 RepID=A0A645FDM7_9ZZZZ